MPFADIYRGKCVLVTGHTGFKGAWLTEWLLALGAKVHGLALPSPTEPALFHQLGLADRVHHCEGDIRDNAVVRRAVADAQPDFVFHLAAQALVRPSYAQPLETYATNVMGTAHVLEALRSVEHPCAAVFVTTDKCYQNREWLHTYREVDPLGGDDPYSSSKAAAEMVIHAYRRSYFSADDSPVRLASARAGNVIGGGDWSVDRIVPDCIRALQCGAAIPVRNRLATRPWQHVLEPLGGYLVLGAALAQTRSSHPLPGQFAVNFGPSLASNRSVGDLVQEILCHWPGRWEDRSEPTVVHEATLLNLAIDVAYHTLGWRPVWDFSQTVSRSVQWYRAVFAGADPVALTRQEIADYVAEAGAAGLPWARQG